MASVLVVLDKFTATDFMMYDENYLTKLNQEVRDAFGTPKATWLKEHGIQIKEKHDRLSYDMSTRIVIYAKVEDKLATEYYLRF